MTVEVMALNFDADLVDSLSNVILTIFTILGTIYGLAKWYNYRQKTKIEKEIKYYDAEESIHEIKEGYKKILDKIEDSIQNIKDLKDEQDHIIIALTLTSTRFKKIYEDIKNIKKDKNE